MDPFYFEKKVLVTGGAGLIGSFVVDRLCALGAKVVVLDNFSRGKHEYLNKSLNQIEVVDADILDAAKASKAFESVDIVFHLASKVFGIKYSSSNHNDMLFYNDTLTNAFFDYLKNTSVKHLVIASSSCVYDDNGPETTAELDVFDGLPEKANAGYGWAKRFLELKSRLWAEEQSVPLTIVRPFNIYGERYTWANNFSQAIPMLVKKILDNNDSIEIWGSGNQRRNFMHASDCANMIIDLAKKNQQILTVNVGTSDTVSFKELVEKMCVLYKKNPRIIFRTDMPEGRTVKSSDDTQLFKLLPEYKTNRMSLETGLLKMQEWYAKTFNSVCAES